MKIKNVLYLPSGRVFLVDVNGYRIEMTEMRDVTVGGKDHFEVRSSMNPHVIWKHLKPFDEKWLMTVSTQKGCVHNCKFCDVASLPFKGNLTADEILTQVGMIISATPYVEKCDKVKIGFARMVEPAHNLDNVLFAIKNLNQISLEAGRNFNWLPCFNSILPIKPMGGISGYDVIDKVIEMKEKEYKGFLHFQISCNSTDENKRKELFGGAEVLSIENIVSYINSKTISHRTVTLNFIVMNGVEVDVMKLKKMGLNGDKFTVKLIPLNNTINAEFNDLTTVANYNNYETLLELGQEFNNIGVPTVIDAIAKCEEAGLCCGQLAQIFA